MTAPHSPDKLVGSKWTAVDVESRRKHWEVISFDDDAGEVTLRAVIDAETKAIPWRNLRDRDRWKPGWQ
jgi:tryptophan-rich hypothetical protein